MKALRVSGLLTSAPTCGFAWLAGHRIEHLCINSFSTGMSRNGDPQNPREAEVVGQVVVVQPGIRRQN